MKEILKLICKADNDFCLLSENDRVVVGVSGGKDSVLLLYALSLYQKFKTKKFELIGVHMQMGFPDSDITAIKEFARERNIEFHVYDVPIYEILTYYKKKDGTLDCSRCSNLKRGAIVDIAKKLNANKVAFAHHGDDALETLLMNTIYSAKLDTFKPSITYKDNNITFIRPLIYAYEREIVKAMKKEKLPIVLSNCPKDGNSSRSKIKKTLSALYEDYPSSKNNLIKSLSYEQKIWKKSNH